MANPDSKRKIRVKTEDGATDVIGVHTIEVTNLTLTDDGGGVVSIDTGGGGGGSGETNTSSTSGSGAALTLAKVGVDLPFRGVKGVGATIATDTDSLTITAASAAQGANADTALANAATAQTTANNAQSAADAAQGTADLALPKITTYRTVAPGSPGSEFTLTEANNDLGGVILANSAAAGFNLQLTTSIDGFQCVVINTGANPVTIDSGVGDGLVNGAGTVTITNPYDAATIIFAGGTAYAIGV